MEKKASFVGRLLSENQMSEAFINSMFLALSGGFQDAYTYNCRDEVFSNAQTGNVVLMSQNFLEGNFTAGLRYLFPILFLRWVYFWQKFPGALPVCKEAALAAGTSRGGNCDPCDRRIYSVLL